MKKKEKLNSETPIPEDKGEKQIRLGRLQNKNCTSKIKYKEQIIIIRFRLRRRGGKSKGGGGGGARGGGIGGESDEEDNTDHSQFHSHTFRQQASVEN